MFVFTLVMIGLLLLMFKSTRLTGVVGLPTHTCRLAVMPVGAGQLTDVSQPQAHPRATTGSFLSVSRDFTLHRHVGNQHQAWLPVLLLMPVSVRSGGTIECCLFKFPS